MEDRIAVLERDVETIKTKLALLRQEYEDVAQLREDVTQLRSDGANVVEEVASIHVRLTKLAAQQANFEAHREAYFASKADLKSSESNTRAWMQGIALSMMTLTFAMIYPLYGALKVSPLGPQRKRSRRRRLRASYLLRACGNAYFLPGW